MKPSFATRLHRWMIALLAVACLPAAAATSLLTPAQLSTRLAGANAPRVVDIRMGQDASGRTAYAAGHIAGSLPAPYPKWRGPAENPGQVPARAELVALVQSLGIDADTPVVVVSEGDDSTDFGAAARVYWTLKAAGVRNLAILNGGLTAWRDAGLPMTTEVPRIARSSFDFALDARLMATRADVRRAVETKNAVLLDARPKPYFDGQTKHEAATAPGTIAGAVDLDNAIWFAGGSSTIDDPDEIRRIAQQQGVDLVRPTVSFCNTGHWSATNWFVLSEILGHPDVKMYPESMVDWSRAGGAMDNVPGRLQQFARQLSQAVSSK